MTLQHGASDGLREQRGNGIGYLLLLKADGARERVPVREGL
jgi:hypothetical protein